MRLGEGKGLRGREGKAGKERERDRERKRYDCKQQAMEKKVEELRNLKNEENGHSLLHYYFEITHFRPTFQICIFTSTILYIKNIALSPRS